MLYEWRFAWVVWVALVLSASLGLAQDMEQAKVVFEHAIPNIQNKKMVSVLVTYPPGAKSLPHHHAPSSFVYAYVVSGAIRSKVGGGADENLQLRRKLLRSPWLLSSHKRKRERQRSCGSLGCLHR